jgi:hypothetical protein
MERVVCFTNFGHWPVLPAGLFRADIVAKVAERTLWNRNLKQSNRGLRAFESMLRIRARS